MEVGGDSRPRLYFAAAQVTLHAPLIRVAHDILEKTS